MGKLLSNFLTISLHLPVTVEEFFCSNRGAQEGPCHTIYCLSPSVVGLLWQQCHTLFFQKAFLANAKGHSLSLHHMHTYILHPFLCPKPAQTLLAFAVRK